MSRKQVTADRNEPGGRVLGHVDLPVFHPASDSDADISTVTFPGHQGISAVWHTPADPGGGVFSLPVAAANVRLGAWFHAGCRSLTGLSTQHSARGLPHTHPGLVLPGMHSVRNCRNNALPTQGI